MKRRDALRRLCEPVRCCAGTAMLRPDADACGARHQAPAVPPAPRGLPPIRIKDIQTILTAPNRIRLVVVKVVTDQPGLHGWGCATFTQRALVVKTAIDQYLKPFLIGRRVDEIEDIYQSLVRQLVLAQRPRALQRDERRRHRAVGHPRQARRPAALPTARRQGPPRRRLLLPRQRPRLQGSRGQRPQGHVDGLPPRPRAGRLSGLATYGARSGDQKAAGLRTPSRSARPAARRSGSRPATCACCRSCSRTCGRRSATRCSCCTTCTSACS